MGVQVVDNRIINYSISFYDVFIHNMSFIVDYKWKLFDVLFWGGGRFIGLNFRGV